MITLSLWRKFIESLQDMCDDYINFVIIVLSLGSISGQTSVFLKNTLSTSKFHIQACVSPWNFGKLSRHCAQNEQIAWFNGSCVIGGQFWYGLWSMVSMDNANGATALIQQLLHRQQRRHHEITPAYMTNTSNKIIISCHQCHNTIHVFVVWAVGCLDSMARYLPHCTNAALTQIDNALSKIHN